MAKIIIKSILIVLFVSGQAYSQGGFINPFKIGNYFEYLYNEQTFSYRYKAKITNDTIINGQKFIVMRFYDEPAMGNYSVCYRLDTATLKIYNQGFSSCADSTGYGLIGGFKLPIGFTWDTCGSGAYHKTQITDTGTTSQLYNSGIPLKAFIKKDTTGLVELSGITYWAEMFGYCYDYRSGGSPFSNNWYEKILRGAIIDGIRYGEILSDINQISTEIPAGYELKQNYPNPFNPSTVIQFAIPKKQSVKISVFNSLGQEINVLVNEIKDAGTYQYIFNGKNLTSGIYFYRIETKDFTETKRMVLVK